MPPAQSTDKTLTLARRAVKARDWATANEHYQFILKRFPGNRQARKALEALKPIAVPELLKTAQTAQAGGRWSDAEQYLGAAAALAPELPEIGLALAACRMEMGRAPAALRAAESVLKRMPGHPEALNAKACALREMGRSDESQECLLSALGHGAADAQTLNNLGILARARGDRSAAAAYYRRAIALQPRNIPLHRNLAHAMTYAADEPHLEQMHTLLAASDQNDPAIAPLHFALFKALDDLDEPRLAFTHLEKANRLTNTALGYRFQTDAVPYALSKILFKVPIQSDPPPPGLRPIFVTGLPRSGTTLVERILAQAEGVQPCGELTVVQVAVGRLLRQIMTREDKSLTARDIAGLRQELLQGLAEYSDGRPVLIDKMPLNFRWIGHICAALPEARIVHISRDPMAVAWSLYRHSFAGTGNAFVYDPSDIARFMVLHRDLMAHWHACCPGRIFDLDYAALVSDTTSTTQALALATGLEWSDDWLSPERSTSQVLTASAEQARRPIYRGSDDGWKRYETHLAQLTGALGSAGVI